MSSQPDDCVFLPVQVARSMAAGAELELTRTHLEEREGQLASSQASVAVAHQELQRCAAQIHQAEIQIQIHQGQIQQQEQALVSEATAAEAIRAELATRQTEVSKLGAQLSAAGGELQVRQAGLEQLRAALEGAEARLAAAGMELAARQAALEGAEARLEAAGTELAARQAALEGSEARLVAESAALAEVSGRLQAEGQVRIVWGPRGVSAYGVGLCGDQG